MPTMTQPRTEYLTVAQISEELNIPKSTIHEWIQQKKLTAYKLGRNWKVKRSDLEEYIKSTRNR